MKKFNYGEDYLSPGLALDIARGKVEGVISESAAEKITKCSNDVQTIVDNQKTVYGINTGFGPLCTSIISEENPVPL